ncbi:unnamed protein product [Amoebophrya sp. A120]|nr:unnamed protein product [Amoebophrya sp. A120]|eukprot:GSA120T00011510001.1
MAKHNNSASSWEEFAISSFMARSGTSATAASANQQPDAPWKYQKWTGMWFHPYLELFFDDGEFFADDFGGDALDDSQVKEIFDIKHIAIEPPHIPPRAWAEARRFQTLVEKSGAGEGGAPDEVKNGSGAKEIKEVVDAVGTKKAGAAQVEDQHTANEEAVEMLCKAFDVEPKLDAKSWKTVLITTSTCRKERDTKPSVSVPQVPTGTSSSSSLSAPSRLRRREISANDGWVAYEYDRSLSATDPVVYAMLDADSQRTFLWNEVSLVLYSRDRRLAAKPILAEKPTLILETRGRDGDTAEAASSITTGAEPHLEFEDATSSRVVLQFVGTIGKAEADSAPLHQSNIAMFYEDTGDDVSIDVVCSLLGETKSLDKPRQNKVEEPRKTTLPQRKNCPVHYEQGCWRIFDTKLTRGCVRWFRQGKVACSAVPHRQAKQEIGAVDSETVTTQATVVPSTSVQASFVATARDADEAQAFSEEWGQVQNVLLDRLNQAKSKQRLKRRILGNTGSSGPSKRSALEALPPEDDLAAKRRKRYGVSYLDLHAEERADRDREERLAMLEQAHAEVRDLTEEAWEKKTVVEKQRALQELDTYDVMNDDGTFRGSQNRNRGLGYTGD